MIPLTGSGSTSMLKNGGRREQRRKWGGARAGVVERTALSLSKTEEGGRNVGVEDEREFTLGPR